MSLDRFSRLALILNWAGVALPMAIMVPGKIKTTGTEDSWFMGITFAVSIIVALWSSDRPRVVALLLVPILLGGVSAGSAAGLLEYRHLKTAELEKHLSDYINIATVSSNPEGMPVTLGRKMVAIDKDKNEIDSIQLRFPAEIGATNPADVKTVLWMNWENVDVGNYGGKGTAYKVKCTVTMIDMTNPPTIAGVKTFEGSDPPSESSSTAYGSTPFDEIISYLKSVSK